ncbi:Protein-N(5)-glutamine methyltransferase PrmC, methylates polypeptide chain release factors RF1 and RF2 [hydrothermal vent metagenome]|uniref:peptide chain release factor N(5)-glutamine methyltransferase n=1 Tax=hydrothermal vent metagenome TaxID=652676 RepID=A0A1W1BDA7_9ZZZZ
MTINRALSWATEQLSESCDRPRYEAELLLAHHIDRDRIYFFTHDDEPIDRVDEFRELVDRRASHEPYEYIVGRVSFYDIELSIVSGVLIPRPETEMLIDEASAIIEQHSITKVIEIGVGSGAISIVLARKFPHLEIVATDINPIALKLAKENIDNFGLSDRITLLQSHLMDSVELDAQMVVSNPPYIAKDFRLDANVVEYEPHDALFGGDIGDELLIEIVKDTKARSIEWLICEMGYDQKASMERLFGELNIEKYRFYKDLAKFDRGFIVRF